MITIIKKNTWVDDVRKGLDSLPGGIGHRTKIFKVVREIQSNRGKKEVETFEHTVQATLNKHSRGMGCDIFFPVNEIVGGRGDGYWGVKEKGEIFSTENWAGSIKKRLNTLEPKAREEAVKALKTLGYLSE